jgi:hypothetical protein
LLARGLKYISEDDYTTYRSQVEEIARMLSGLIKTLSGVKG